jgi:hypothetical protein
LGIPVFDDNRAVTSDLVFQLFARRLAIPMLLFKQLAMGFLSNSSALRPSVLAGGCSIGNTS